MNETPQTAHTPEPLLPCPFCGRKPKTDRYSSLIEVHGSAVIKCEKCNVALLERTPESALAAWNRRTGIQDPAGALLVAKAALEAAAESLGYFRNSEFWSAIHAADHEQVVAALAKLSAISPAKV